LSHPRTHDLPLEDVILFSRDRWWQRWTGTISLCQMHIAK